MFEIKITANTLPELASAILAVAENYRTILAGGDAAPAEDKPKRTRAKAEPAAAAAETPAASKLEPADEGNGSASSATTSESSTDSPASASPAATDEKPAGPTRDDALTAATKFSQTHGVEKLEAALEAVGAKKFSEVPADKYAAFIAEMDKASAASSALS